MPVNQSEAEIERLYVSAGCNRTPHCLDWGLRNNLVCYGSNCSIIVYDPSRCRVVHTLVAHTGRVNVVRWIGRHDSTEDEVELMSASSDSNLISWKLVDGRPVVLAVLSGHSTSVNNLTALHARHSLFVASASSDSTVKIWLRDSTNAQCLNTDTIQLDRRVCLAMDSHLLPGTESPILALSTDNFLIHLYHVKSSGKCVQLASLSGHEDWVQDLAFVQSNTEEVLLASCSQDTTVRLWKLSSREEVYSEDEFRLDKLKMSVEDRNYTVALESVLMGHEGWIYSVKWMKNDSELVLMTASSDRTILLWSSSEDDGGVWMERVRLGELGGEQLGYLGACFGDGGKSLIAHDHQGAFHLWTCTRENVWAPQVAPSGHFDGVSDIAWETNGLYLISTSLDQTTRIHAPWRRSDDTSWCELARPQIHGYSLNSVTVLRDFGFVTGADEKVARVFYAPKTFLENLVRLSNVQVDDDILEGAEPTGATVPALGLSNKAIFTNESNWPSEQPPNEDTLLQNTLWPETMKLYGHGNELYSVAATHRGDLLATACKQTSSQNAPIILWNTSTWEKVSNFDGNGHSLTVTQMMFSPNDNFLLSVSRDRNWCLFERTDDSFKLRLATTKETTIHKRIIWGCSWSHDSSLFATVSRDSLLAIWDVSRMSPDDDASPKSCLASSQSLGNDATTAVAFAPRLISDKYCLAVGFESGRVECFSFEQTPSGTSWCQLFAFNDSHRTITRLLFKPLGNDGNLVFASCSLDHSVRVYNVGSGLTP